MRRRYGRWTVRWTPEVEEEGRKFDGLPDRGQILRWKS